MATAGQDSGGSHSESKTTRTDHIDHTDHTTDQLTVLIGAEDDQTLFTIDQKVACAKSDFFKVMLRSGRWKVSIEGVAKSPEVDEDVFSIYANWLSTGNADLHLSMDPSVTFADEYPDESGSFVRVDKNDKNNSAQSLYMIAIDAFALGEMLQDFTFQNAVMDSTIQVVKQYHWYPGTFPQSTPLGAYPSSRQ
ncbi:uncharacterized protein LTR77_010148 [Saxophila tyrrhenica]|uniref:BTB domain-containing protein n=1 Tax=Saxophila tyrrhenica TaxID=1690608 RepID=A0AAV9NZE9_9PEZI|nr:hypothetical protein LTR77_010148 [Saxophila tyrrhenica]